MKRLIFHCILFILLINSINLYSQSYQLKSPSGNNIINIENGEILTFSVTHDGKTIINPSPISLMVDGKKLGENGKVRNSQSKSVNQTIEPIIKEKYAVINDHYNQLEINFRGNYSLEFRSFDDGIAYRFKTSFKNDITIENEEINFQFLNDHQATFPIADGFMTHYERKYFTMPISALAEDSMSCIPLMVHLDDGVKAVITEADLLDYPGFYMKKTGHINGLNAVFPFYPKTEDVRDDRNVGVSERETYMAKTKGQRSFPWRLVVISDEDADLIESTLVYQLSSPSQLSDTDWIKPGKVAWDWYNALNIYGVDFESGVNTDTYKYYIDFAAEYNLDYIILDEGWYDIKTNDLLHPVADIDMESIIAHGNAKNVDIILWVTWKALEDQLDDALVQFSKWGVKGIKVDFMQRDDQWMVNYYEKIAKRGAEYKLLVDFHGSYKPTGLRRTYPNVINREGVSGLENNKWGGQLANPQYDVELPFLRMLAGPLDYTPGAMINAQRRNYQPIFQRPMSLGTRCHQLAMYVVFESPLQMLADSPSNYYREPVCMEFLSVVPTVWDDTKVLSAQFGDFVTIARKNGADWYVGAMTDWESRDLEIDFSFLDEGAYNIDIYQDGVNAEKHAGDFKKITKKITRNSKEAIHLASGGGWAARIYR